MTGVVGFSTIAIIFFQEFEQHNDSKSVIGIVSAVFASVTYGLYFVLIRLACKLNGGAEPDLHACNIISGLVVCLVSLCIGIYFLLLLLLLLARFSLSSLIAIIRH